MLRLLILILVFVVFLLFIVFNLGNECDISLRFYTFQDVPVFLTVFFSFILGMIIMAPFAFSLGRRRRKRFSPPSSSAKAPVPPPPAEKKKLFTGFGKNRKGKEAESGGAIKNSSAAEVTEIKKEKVSYGID